MDKKALIKAILATIGVVAYTIIGAVAIITESPLFIGLMIGPIIGAALIASVYAFYEIFKD